MKQVAGVSTNLISQRFILRDIIKITSKSDKRFKSMIKISSLDQCQNKANSPAGMKRGNFSISKQ